MFGWLRFTRYSKSKLLGETLACFRVIDWLVGRFLFLFFFAFIVCGVIGFIFKNCDSEVSWLVQVKDVQKRFETYLKELNLSDICDKTVFDF